jgi:type I restriction enzyme S subunit
LIDQLSSFQHEVWNTLRYEWRGAVLADDPAVFNDFCTSPQTAWRFEGFDVASINVRRALEQLAAVGLIRKFSLPQNDPSNETVLYLTAFRPLREDKNGGRAEEDVALADVTSVQTELKRRQKGGV